MQHSPQPRIWIVGDIVTRLDGIGPAFHGFAVEVSAEESEHYGGEMIARQSHVCNFAIPAMTSQILQDFVERAGKLQQVAKNYVAIHEILTARLYGSLGEHRVNHLGSLF